MTSIPISIGMQCTSAAFLKDKNIRRHSFPFDWMLAPPSFIYEMLRLLLKENINPQKLVAEYFYVLDKKVDIDLSNIEHYFTVSNPNMPNKLNSRYDVVFPHDYSYDQTVVKEKYTRRFQRLKDLILDKNTKLDFYYVSQSSPTKGNFTIDGRNVVVNVFQNIRLINDLIMEFHGNNFNIHVFDTLHQEKPENYFTPETKIHLYSLGQRDKFFELIPQMMSINVQS